MTVLLDCPECGEIDSLEFEVGFTTGGEYMGQYEQLVAVGLVAQECDCSFYREDWSELEEAAIERANDPDEPDYEPPWDWYRPIVGKDAP